jgi:hypothetical protein
VDYDLDYPYTFLHMHLVMYARSRTHTHTHTNTHIYTHVRTHRQIGQGAVPAPAGMISWMQSLQKEWPHDVTARRSGSVMCVQEVTLCEKEFMSVFA